MDSVENICNHLARYKVLDTETVRTLRSRWREQNKERSDQPAEFKRWLVRTGYVTDFQLDLLTRGFGEHLFLDEYKLVDRLAKGRHAGVFQAVHSSGQKVAIKVLPPSKSKNPHVLSRFLREARLATRLDHDNIVRTFHHGKTAEGTQFIVMEFLEGETLEDVIQRRKRLPAAEAVRLVIQGLEGLQHLDEKSMIHRDIKPANLMLVPPKELPKRPGEASAPPQPDTTLKSTLKILDIGLSRALFDEGEPETGENVDLTREGTLLGTMNYMAPEQARDAHGADIRADIYGLGCVLYELLAGQPPFPDKNMSRQIRRHAEETPRSLLEAAPGTPQALDKIVQKMLAKDPAMRHLTPGQAIKDLRLVLGMLGDSATAPQPERPLKTFMTWLETKREPDAAAPDGKAIPVPAGPDAAKRVLTQVAAPVPSQTKLAMAAPGTKLGPAATAPEAARPMTVVALPPSGPAPAPPAPAAPAPVQQVAPPAVATAPASPAAAAAAAPAVPAPTVAPGTKPAPFKTFLNKVALKSKDYCKRFVQAVRALNRREWCLIGIGALIVLLLEGVWSVFQWLSN